MNILFLCTGNSCRSQMAEGFLRAMAGDRVEVQSAGIEAHGKNPQAIKVMDEVGIDIRGQESTAITEEMLNVADLVITVCGHADEHCPILPSGTRCLHWPIADPAKATGTDEEVLVQFRVIRDEIRARVDFLIDEELIGGKA